MATVLTPKFRASYPHLFKPQKNDLNGKTEYSIVAIFPKGTDLTPLKKAAEAVLVEKFGADNTKWPTNLRNPFRKCSERWKNDGGKQSIPAGYEDGDAIFMTFKQDAEKSRPTVVDQQVQEILEPQHVYAGMYARASVRPYYYNQKGNQGVSFGLNNVQKMDDGEPLGGGKTRAQDDFEAVAADMAAQSAGSLFD